MRYTYQEQHQINAIKQRQKLRKAFKIKTDTIIRLESLNALQAIRGLTAIQLRLHEGLTSV